MDKQAYIGKTVISAKTNYRFIMTKIHAAYITLRDQEPDKNAVREEHTFEVISQDPFSEGTLYFEDKALNNLFIKEYNDYRHSEEGHSEAMMHWILTGN